MKRMFRCSTSVLAFAALLVTVSSKSALAAVPGDASVSCESSWPVSGKYPMLQHRTLPGGKIEYYGRYKFWSPIGNKLECKVRQLVFNVGRLANDLPGGTANGPVLTFVVEHGIFHCRAKDLILDPNIGINANGADFVEYTVDVQAAKPKRGIYYAQVSVVGLPAQ